ncbi:Wzz/FepE/Etk N-terminal domain-containing protein [Candidatus Pelagibacter sp.]|nr:Wzz/FepE/Etk N-terminal domain-containing protein [Candidatus Pelagibacter sp.]
MKKIESHNIKNDEIDIATLIKSLWKDKIFIIFISLLCMSLIYGYNLSTPKTVNKIYYKTTVVIKNPQKQLFLAYDIINLSPNSEDRNYANQYKDNFYLNLNSRDALQKFFNQNKNIDEFKNYLKDNNLKAMQYLNESFRKINNSDTSFQFTFPQELKGDDFLNDYVHYIKFITINEFISQLKKIIDISIDLYESNLLIAEAIKLEDPLIQTMTYNQTSSVVNEPPALYYKGTKVLSKQIDHLKKLSENLKYDLFDYNPILDTASIPQKKIDVNEIEFVPHPVLGLIGGFFLSLLIIFFRRALN